MNLDAVIYNAAENLQSEEMGNKKTKEAPTNSPVPPEPSSGNEGANVSRASPPSPKGKTQTASGSVPEDAKPQNVFQLILQVLDKLGALKPIVIVCLIMGAALSFVWSQIPEQGKLAIIERLSSSGSSAGIYPSVEIAQTTYRYDLSEWTAVPPSGDATHTCKVTTDEFLLLRRVRTDARYLARRASTTGVLPEFTSDTHEVTYKKAHEEQKAGPRMSHYDVLLDISKEPVDVPFKAHLRSVRFGAFRDPHSEWSAIVILQPTRTFTLEVQFPKDKPGKNFRFSTSGTFDGNNYRPLDVAPAQFTTSNNAIKWTIDFPQLGYSYRIDWDW